MPDTPAGADAGTILEHPEKHHTVTIGSTEYLTVAGLAALLHVSPRTIQRWDTLREGPPRCLRGRVVLYPVEGVNKWLADSQRADVRRRSRGTAP